MTDWVQKAGRAKIREKAQAVYDAFNRVGLYNEPTFETDRKALASALLEAINQTQNGQGMISAADLHLIAMEMKKL